MINEQLTNKQQDIKSQLTNINKLFKDLLNIYQYQFPKELILYELIDCTKLQVFKQLILELTNNHVELQSEWNKFKQQIKLITSLPELKDTIKKSILHIVTNTKKLKDRDKRKIIFYANQSLNYTLKQQPEIIDCLLNGKIITNIEKTFLLKIKQFLINLINDNGYFNIAPQAKHAFIIGNNIATTKNNIVYSNNIMQLIKYTPHDIKHIKHKTPILFIPPCANKYYILDLSPKNSLIKWLLQEGFIVYVIDWLNPNSCYKTATFADYIVHGTAQAINIIADQDTPAVHLAGYCMGGTILSITLSYVEQLKKVNILSATYIMTATDFNSFKTVRKTSLDQLSEAINKIGYLDGRILSTIFHIINPNELMLPYFINHYLLNKPLSNFDAIYWYSEPVNLPANMYNFYIREICFNNNLCDANKIIINNIKINLTSIQTPIFFIAGEYDPISDWRLIYESMQIYSKSKNRKFILVQGGHISSLLASPDNNNNSYKINDALNINKQDATNWYNNSIQIQESWWSYWKNWLSVC